MLGSEKIVILRGWTDSEYEVLRHSYETKNEVRIKQYGLSSVKKNEVFRAKQYGFSSVKKNEIFRVKQYGLSSVKKNEVFRVKQYGLSSVKKNELGYAGIGK